MPRLAQAISGVDRNTQPETRLVVLGGAYPLFGRFFAKGIFWGVVR